MTYMELSNIKAGSRLPHVEQRIIINEVMKMWRYISDWEDSHSEGTVTMGLWGVESLKNLLICYCQKRKEGRSIKATSSAVKCGTSNSTYIIEMYF